MDQERYLISQVRKKTLNINMETTRRMRWLWMAMYICTEVSWSWEIIIKKKNLVLYYDYKLFKDNYKKIPFESIQVYFEDNGILMNAPQGVNVPKGNTNVNNVICFDLDGKEVKSEGEIPLEVIIKISKHLHQNR